MNKGWSIFTTPLEPFIKDKAPREGYFTIADDPENLIGSVVLLPTNATDISNVTGTAEQLLNFRDQNEKITVSPLTSTWDLIYDQTLTKQASASLSFLS